MDERAAVDLNLANWDERAVAHGIPRLAALIRDTLAA